MVEHPAAPAAFVPVAAVFVIFAAMPELPAREPAAVVVVVMMGMHRQLRVGFEVSTCSI
jgi:hypothetical protein